MNERQILATIKSLRARDRLLVSVLRDSIAQSAWLRARLLELHQRVRVIDGITPEGVPPWPPVEIPPELRDILSSES